MDPIPPTRIDGCDPVPDPEPAACGERAPARVLVTWEWGSRGRTWVVRAVPGREVVLTAATCREAIRRAEAAGHDVVGPHRSRRSRPPRPRQLSFPFY